MNDVLLISVVLPVYNGAEYLHEAIDSILSQTFKDFEFIIINDGSTDDSEKIIASYEKDDSRIRFISRENKGLIYSLNEGIKLSKGKYIARMDADDVSLPMRFEKQVAVLENGADICGCHFLHIDERGKKTRTKLVPLSEDSIQTNMALTTPFAHGSVMMRKSFLTCHELFYDVDNANSAEDYDLWIKMFDKKACFSNVDDFLFLYRDYSNSLSKHNSKSLKKDAKALSYNQFKTKYKCIESAILNLLSTSLSEDEKDCIIGCALYLARYRKSIILFKVIKVIPIKNTINGVLKFVTGRFF